MSLSLAFCISLFLSIALIPVLIRFAPRLGLIDVPDGVRKVHTQTIPRCGGIAIALASLLPSIYFAQHIHLQTVFIGTSLIIIFFGYLDDRFDLSYKWKFSGQIAATTILILALPEISRLPFFLEPAEWAWLGYFGVFVFVIATTNAVNLTDGLDGLAGGTILLSLALIAYLAWSAEIENVTLIAIALIGALLGFLRYNTHPATVFMGDTGSQFIGFSTAVLAIFLTQDTACAVSPVLPLLIVGLPLIDTMMVMTIRIRQGRSPFSPDKNHIHHQLINFGLRHYEAVAVIYCVQITFILLAFFMRYADDEVVFAVYFLYSACLLAALYGLNRRRWRFRAEELTGTERRNQILRKFGFMHQYGPYLVLALMTGLWWLLAAQATPDHNAIPGILIAGLGIVTALSLISRTSTALASRSIAYLACAACTYLSWSGMPKSSFPHAPDILTMASAGALALSILVTRREKFHLDNQDILILALLSGASLLPLSTPPNFGTTEVLVRLVVMLYAVEFLLHSLDRHVRWLQLVSVAALFIFAFNII